jgi:hypothetical protein
MFRRCAAKEHTSPSLVVTPSSLEHSAGVLALEFLASRKKSSFGTSLPIYRD